MQKAAPPPIEVPELPLEELKEKTDNFGSKALIGEGSYGRVYYANLSTGKAVAVKKLDVSSEPETNNEFLTQVYPQLSLNYLLVFVVIDNSICIFFNSFNPLNSGFHGVKIEA